MQEISDASNIFADEPYPYVKFDEKHYRDVAKAKFVAKMGHGDCKTCAPLNMELEFCIFEKPNDRL